ncbi:hypothetical protein [Streptomyces lutosisoli]|uniref:Uncharacterized protein n=1 Tax=Streptomyces lutosisoli TaxID=2665721 RepID=A0ABW2VS94_9ACTN
MTMATDRVDPSLSAIGLVTGVLRVARIDAAISVSFSFGGQSSGLVFRRA